MKTDKKLVLLTLIGLVTISLPLILGAQTGNNRNGLEYQRQRIVSNIIFCFEKNKESFPLQDVTRKEIFYKGYIEKCLAETIQFGRAVIIISGLSPSFYKMEELRSLLDVKLEQWNASPTKENPDFWETWQTNKREAANNDDRDGQNDSAATSTGVKTENDKKIDREREKGLECDIKTKINNLTVQFRPIGFEIGEGLVLPSVITPTGTSSLSIINNPPIYDGIPAIGNGIPTFEVGPLFYVTDLSRHHLADICELSSSIQYHAVNIDDQTAKIKEEIEIIRTVQQRFEEKTFVTDPDVRKQARQKIASTTEEMVRMINEGRTTSDGRKKASFTPTPADYIREEIRTEVGLYLETIKESDLPDEVKFSLIASIRDSALTLIDKETKTNSLLQYEKLSPSDANDPWKRYEHARNNNVYELLSNILNDLGARLEEREENARETLVANGGFVPETKCLEWVDSPLGRVCRYPETKTAGRTIAAVNEKLQTAEIDQAITAGGFGDHADAINVTRTIPRVIQDKEPVGQPGGAGDSTGGGGTGGGTSGGTGGGGTGGSTDGGGTGGGGTEVDKPQITINQKPIIIANQKVGAVLAWETQKATSCQTAKPWQLFGSRRRATINPFSINGDIGASGSFDIFSPALFAVNVEAKSNMVISSPQTLITGFAKSDSTFTQITRYMPNLSNLMPGYTIIFTIESAPVSITIKNPTKTEIVNELAEKLRAIKDFKDFTFITTTEGVLIITKTVATNSPVPTNNEYGLMCESKTGSRNTQIIQMNY